jgi:SET domain-containing protein
MLNNHPFLKRKKSLIDGQGIFTEKEIKEGERFYFIPLDKVFNKPTSKSAFIGNNKYVNDEAILNWVNHSCDFNTSLDILTPEPFLIAVKNIKPEEEITCDYNKTEKGGTEAVCKCKSKKCRGKFLRIE